LHGRGGRGRYRVGRGFECAIALDISIAAPVLRSIGMNVGSYAIGLPDFDNGVFDRVAGAFEDAAAEPGNGFNAGGDGLVDDEQIVVAIQREGVGIIESFGGGGWKSPDSVKKSPPAPRAEVKKLRRSITWA